MPQLLPLLAPKAFQGPEFQDVQFIPDGIEGSQYRYKARLYYTAAMVNKIGRIQFDFAEEVLIERAKKKALETKEAEITSFPKGRNVAEKMAKLKEQGVEIEMPNANELIIEVYKSANEPECRIRMLNEICTPYEGSPVITRELYDQFDEEIVEAVLGFFTEREKRRGTPQPSSTPGTKNKNQSSSSQSTDTDTLPSKGNKKKKTESVQSN